MRRLITIVAFLLSVGLTLAAQGKGSKTLNVARGIADTAVAVIGRITPASIVIPPASMTVIETGHAGGASKC